MPAWMRSFAIAPLPGIDAAAFEETLHSSAVPAVSSGATRGGTVESAALYRTPSGHYRWLVRVSTVTGAVGDPPGFVHGHFDRALELLTQVGVVYDTEDLVEV
ncbi:MAG TPA: hypothetical protein VIK95_14040 [Egibacteraceae bacterium]